MCMVLVPPCEVSVGTNESHRGHFPTGSKDRVMIAESASSKARDQRGLGPLIDQ